MTVSAVSPCRIAFWRERSFPTSLIGPVLLRAFRRLASIVSAMSSRRFSIGFVSFFCEFPLRPVVLVAMLCPVQVMGGFPATAREQLVSGRCSALPPCRLVAGTVHFAMVSSTQWHRELIADFSSHGAALHETKVMRVRRSPPADQQAFWATDRT